MRNSVPRGLLTLATMLVIGACGDGSGKEKDVRPMDIPPHRAPSGDATYDSTRLRLKNEFGCAILGSCPATPWEKLENQVQLLVTARALAPNPDATDWISETLITLNRAQARLESALASMESQIESARRARIAVAGILRAEGCQTDESESLVIRCAHATPNMTAYADSLATERWLWEKLPPPGSLRPAVLRAAEAVAREQSAPVPECASLQQTLERLSMLSVFVEDDLDPRMACRAANLIELHVSELSDRAYDRIYIGTTGTAGYSEEAFEFAPESENALIAHLDFRVSAEELNQLIRTLDRNDSDRALARAAEITRLQTMMNAETASGATIITEPESAAGWRRSFRLSEMNSAFERLHSIMNVEEFPAGSVVELREGAKKCEASRYITDFAGLLSADLAAEVRACLLR